MVLPGSGASAGGEQGAEVHTPHLPPIRLGLKVGQPLLEGADGPAAVLLQKFRRNRLRVERADVSEFDDLLGFILFQPAERETLSATDVGARRIDTAAPVCIQKRTTSRRRGCLGCEERAELGSDALRFHVEDGEVVGAATVAAPTAAEAVLRCNARGEQVDLRMERTEPFKVGG